MYFSVKLNVICIRVSARTVILSKQTIELEFKVILTYNVALDITPVGMQLSEGPRLGNGLALKS